MSPQRIELGGPGAACSAQRVRRWRAGELPAAEAEKLAEHVRGCERCAAAGRELAEEQRALAEVLAFDDFAAGVAERLARKQGPPRVVSLTARRRWQAWALPASVAAALALVIGSAAITRQLAEGARVAGRIPLEPRDDARIRLKGGAAPALELFALRGGRSFKLAEHEPIERGDRLLVVLPATQRKQAVVALREGDEVSILYRGAAREGPLPEAFEWTGASRRGQLLALFTELPADLPALTERLRRGEPASSDARDVIVSREVTRR